MEEYVIQLATEATLVTRAEPSSLRRPKRCRRERTVISVHLSNLRNRPLSDEDMEAITECVPELYSRLHQVSGLSSLTVVDEQLLRPPTDFTVVEPVVVLPEIMKLGTLEKWNAPLPQPPTVKPPAVMSKVDSVIHQEFPGSLVTPRHPDTLTPLAPFRRNSSCQYDFVERNGQWLPRVISHVGTTSGRVVRRQWRVSLYRTDGQMMLSVFCRFPEEVSVRRRLDFHVERQPLAGADERGLAEERKLSRRVRSRRLGTRLRL